MSSKVFFCVFCLIIETTIFVSTANADNSEQCTVQFNPCQIKTTLPGKPGEKGEKGFEGQKGDKGYVGHNGLPGLDSQNYRSCPEPFNSDDDDVEIVASGIEDKPSDVPCNVIRNNDKPFSGITWVNPSDKFQVNCTGTGLTSLITNGRLKNLTYIEEIAFHLPSTQVSPFWLSNYYSNETNTRFNLTQFYNMITPKQIAWLQHTTKQATQIIRIHCKNFYVLEKEKTGLRLFSSNDVVIEPFSSDSGPLYYTIPEGYNNDCKEGAPKTEWRYTDIALRGHSKRLPIIDFYIQDTRAEGQSFFFELLELYFH